MVELAKGDWKEVNNGRQGMLSTIVIPSADVTALMASVELLSWRQ